MIIHTEFTIFGYNIFKYMGKCTLPYQNKGGT